MIADIKSNKKFNPIVTELFFKGQKLNISLAFISKCNTLFYHENSKQRRTSTNSFKSFI